MDDFDPKAYLASKQVAQPVADDGAFDPKAYLASKQTPQAQDPSLGQQAWDGTKYVLGKGLDYGLRGLDYAGGLARTAAAENADVARMGYNAATLSPAYDPKIGVDDWTSALQGKAPRTADYLDKLGVPEGGHVDLMPEIHVPQTPITPAFTLGKGDTSARDAAGFVGDVALDPLTYLSLGSSAAAKEAGLGSRLLETAKKASNTVGDAVANTGTNIYKSGLKAIDAKVAQYGKDPVSDLLMANGIRGNAGTIQQGMDDLGQQLLQKRNDLLKNATRNGGQTSMAEAMAPTQAKIAAMRATNDPRLLPVADALEAEVNKYLPLDPKLPQPTIQTLPYTEKMGGHTPINYDKTNSLITGSPSVMVDNGLGSSKGVGLPGQIELPGKMTASGPTPLKAVPGAEVPDVLVPRQQQFLDMTDPTRNGIRLVDNSGVSPIQSSGFKTTLGATIPDSAYKEGAILNAYQSGNKTLQGGMRAANEASVGRALGPEAQQALSTSNDQLGRILTSSEVAQKEAEKEARRNAFSSVDGLLAGAGAAQHTPQGFFPFLFKKGADVLKATGPRTTGGYYLNQLGNSGLVDPVVRQGVIGLQSPYDQLANQGK